MARPTRLHSVRSLMSVKGPGKTRISDAIFSVQPFRICCFETKERHFVISRKKILDASSVKIKGDSLLVQSLPITQAPPGSFSFNDQGWVRGRDQTRIGDVADILVDDGLFARELIVKIKHQLVLPKETRNLLPKALRKKFMRSMADAMSFTGDSYTLASLPAPQILSINPGELLYEVMIDMEIDDLTNTIFQALQNGREEKGLVRSLFEGMLAE